MCRLLTVKASQSFRIEPHLKIFALISKNSKEYQGHGWGCAYLLENGNWSLYKNINPVWDDDLSQFPKTSLLVVHARSAFEDRDITIENNMPFSDAKSIFIFNGELRGVKIREKGRIGAEKIFNYIRRFDKGNTKEGLKKAIEIIKKRTQYIRGMNIIMVNDQGVHVSSDFNEDNEYFTMYYKKGDTLVICSDPYPMEDDWKPIPNNTMRVW